MPWTYTVTVDRNLSLFIHFHSFDFPLFVHGIILNYHGKHHKNALLIVVNKSSTSPKDDRNIVTLDIMIKWYYCFITIELLVILIWFDWFWFWFWKKHKAAPPKHYAERNLYWFFNHEIHFIRKIRKVTKKLHYYFKVLKSLIYWIQIYSKNYLL